MTSMRNNTSLDDAQLEAMLERASEAGARAALHSIGFGDENARTDVDELRGLLQAWRDTRRQVWITATRWVTIAILGAIAVFVGSRLGVTIKQGP